MTEAAEQYTAAVAAVGPAATRLPVVVSTNPSAVVASADEVDLVPALLGDSLVLPVDWPASLEVARALGAGTGLDVGPGNVLARIGRRAGMKFEARWQPPDPASATADG